MTEAEREALHGTFHRLEQRWNVLPIPPSDVWHAYDPLPFWDFFEGMRRASELTAGRRFLDLGCGIGTKLALAHHLGWEVMGIEHHRPYLDAARELVPEAELAYRDLFEWPFFDADLVYMYRPAVAERLQSDLEAHVLSRVKAGTVMFWPLRHQPEVWVV